MSIFNRGKASSNDDLDDAPLNTEELGNHLQSLFENEVSTTTLKGRSKAKVGRPPKGVQKSEKSQRIQFRLHPDNENEKTALDILDTYLRKGLDTRQVMTLALLNLAGVNPADIVYPSNSSSGHINQSEVIQTVLDTLYVDLNKYFIDIDLPSIAQNFRETIQYMLQSTQAMNALIQKIEHQHNTPPPRSLPIFNNSEEISPRVFEDKNSETLTAQHDVPSKTSSKKTKMLAQAFANSMQPGKKSDQ